MSSARAPSSITSVYIAQVFVVAALLTAAFMLLSATELGALGPLVIAEGLYLGAFALVVEVGLLARAVYVFMVSAIEELRADKLARGAR